MEFTVRVLGSRRGAGLVDALATILIMGMTGVVFSTTFPASFGCSRQAQEYKIATAIAQRKMEQLRGMEYESLSQPLLLAAGLIDQTATASPYSFTSVDSLADQLPQGEGSLSVTDISADQRRVIETLSWLAKTGQTRSVQLTTLFADKRTRQGT